MTQKIYQVCHQPDETYFVIGTFLSLDDALNAAKDLNQVRWQDPFHEGEKVVELKVHEWMEGMHSDFRDVATVKWEQQEPTEEDGEDSQLWKVVDVTKTI